MKNYKYILFDWDGCLAKTLDAWMGAIKKTLAIYNLSPSDLEIGHHFGDWRLLEYFGITGEEYEKADKNLVDMAAESLVTVELYPGARELLEYLRPTKKIALLSSSEKFILDRALDSNNLRKYFDIVISGDEVTNHKPHPEVIEKGLAALGGKKEEAVMIGDSRKDLEAANNAGIDSILVYPPEHKIFYDLDELKAYKPTYVVSELSEIKGII